MEYSLDNGLTWQIAKQNIRVIYRQGDEGFGDDGEEQKELHVNLTEEGIICDVIDSDSGEVLATRCEMMSDVIDNLTS